MGRGFDEQLGRVVAHLLLPSRVPRLTRVIGKGGPRQKPEAPYVYPGQPDSSGSRGRKVSV